jgi:hypothetical protein
LQDALLLISNETKNWQNNKPNKHK